MIFFTSPKCEGAQNIEICGFNVSEEIKCVTPA